MWLAPPLVDGGHPDMAVVLPMIMNQAVRNLEMGSLVHTCDPLFCKTPHHPNLRGSSRPPGDILYEVTWPVSLTRMGTWSMLGMSLFP